MRHLFIKATVACALMALAAGGALRPKATPTRRSTISNSLGGGGRASIVTFPLGLPINSNLGENEVEIRELLRLDGILDP